ncbi:MAG: rhodanese-like domain-containing protein [Saprospiraceae bacterium]|nr:rhodanese-like domain-containing protein [Saprospiraceae bacterium]
MREIRINYILYLIIICFISTSLIAQKAGSADKKFSDMVNSNLSFTVPVISVDELRKMPEGSILLLDTREREEFLVSHIKGALYTGYQDFDATVLKSVPKNRKIVVYCSIGYRSEKIGEKLKKLGYAQVYNLYGSIFEWVNRGFEVVDKDNKPTQRIHGYSKDWSKWISNPKFVKVI